MPGHSLVGWAVVFGCGGGVAKAKNGKRLNGKNTIPVGALIPQPNGRGALRNGGTHKGGLGRPDLAVRERCKHLFAERVDYPARVVDDVKEATKTRLDAWDKLGKYAFEPERRGGLVGIATDGKRVEVVVLYDDEAAE